jgi:DNA repair photolyase
VRWQNLAADQDRDGRLPGIERPPVVRTFDAPEAMGIRFHEVHARSALNSVPAASRMPFRWTINPYRGCTHACSYCFARPTHKYLDLNVREDFEREIVVKVNLPEVLRAELRRPSWKGEHVALGTNTDPYQWVEGRYRITRAVWEELLAVRNPCSVLTKSPLLLRDLDLFRELAGRTQFTANLSIPTVDERAWRQTEPHTPHPRKRIEALAELNRAGIETGVLVAPLMPGINDSPRQLEEVLRLCGEAGARTINGIGLHLRGEVKGVFFDWLREYRPDLLPRYERLYERGAYLPQPERKRLGAVVAGARRKAGGRAAGRPRGIAREDRDPAPPDRGPPGTVEGPGDPGAGGPAGGQATLFDARRSS